MLHADARDDMQDKQARQPQKSLTGLRCVSPATPSCIIATRRIPWPSLEQPGGVIPDATLWVKGLKPSARCCTWMFSSSSTTSLRGRWLAATAASSWRRTYCGESPSSGSSRGRMQHGELHPGRRMGKPAEKHGCVSGDDERRAFTMWSGMRGPATWGVCTDESKSVGERAWASANSACKR